ncbi:YtpI family protein [Bacillus luteolus]|uniref:YtpI family protein n=1 Tax=Litchfieldia luteola TaxID=682179 RepID=A0ABR9QID6_9BACI|nr:YtpI family protein [Cytobacillus luteolus]MBE4908260.1 YtpI family protein [Cytobacillus luteolus]MBP1943046.1 putative membrane-anchored protein [Cytobacillus luteolus]
MPIFVILIIFSLSFYIFYKAKYFRTKRPVEKRWVSAKSSIALGLFVLFFAINQFFLHTSTVSTVVGIVFLLVGGGSIWAGYRAYKYYLPLAIEEANQAK